MIQTTRTVKILLAALFGALSAAPVLRALDFEPEYLTTQNEEGFKTLEVVLRDGPARVVYCPPAGWKAEAGGRFLRFYPPGVSQADLTIDSEKAPPARVLDAAAAEHCRARVKASVPQESSDVVMEADEPNPGAVANCPTFAVTIAYAHGGIRYRKRILFVFASDSEIHFTTVARISEFDRLYPAVRQSLFSWRWERGR